MSKEYKEKKIHSYERKLYEPLGEHGNSVYERREQLLIPIFWETGQ